MSNIDEANKVANLFNSTAKVFTLIGGGIVSCTLAYYMILDNGKEIVQIKKDMKEQFAIQEQRGDNRFSRAMELASKLEGFGIKLEDRVRQLEKENAYLKGKYESTKPN